jgi:hypothetical protein
MPVPYPVRYGDGSGAALVIRTRTGSGEEPRFHASIGMGDSEVLGEGGFGGTHKGTWLLSARKSYLGYLERTLVDSRFSEDSFYDANLKITYDLTPTQTVSFRATGGQTRVNDPTLPASTPDPFQLKTGAGDLAIGRLGWRWSPRKDLLVDARAAYVRSGNDQENAQRGLIDRTAEHEWSGGGSVSWDWHRGAILQAGYSLRYPVFYGSSASVDLTGEPVIFSSRLSYRHEDGYVQNSMRFWKERVRLQGGVRWLEEEGVRVHPVTGQASVAVQAGPGTQLEAGWGRYAQATGPQSIDLGVLGNLTLLRVLPRISSQYIFAVEQRLGDGCGYESKRLTGRTSNGMTCLRFPAASCCKDPHYSAAIIREGYSSCCKGGAKTVCRGGSGTRWCMRDSARTR